VEGEWYALEHLLQHADLLTLHTPLVRDGSHSTLNLIDAATLARFRGRVVINAARGDVVDNRALLCWLQGDSSRLAVLDCWQGEPLIDHELLAHPRLVIATPHIAGHSLDGKAANTRVVYEALCRFLALDGGWRMEAELPAVAPRSWRIDDSDCWQQVAAMIFALYPLARDVSACRALLQQPDDHAFAAAFTHYRRHYPVRRGWQQSPFMLQPCSQGRAQEEVISLAERAGLLLAA